jgi:hypothetical protein
MSRKEIYAWCSLGLTLAIFGYYLVSLRKHFLFEIYENKFAVKGINYAIDA